MSDTTKRPPDYARLFWSLLLTVLLLGIIGYSVGSLTATSAGCLTHTSRIFCGLKHSWIVFWPDNLAGQVVLIGAIASIIFKHFRSHGGVCDEKLPPFFGDERLNEIPGDRIGYSDRTAYVMGELSQMAYTNVDAPDNPLIALRQNLEILSNQQANPQSSSKALDSADLGQTLDLMLNQLHKTPSLSSEKFAQRLAKEGFLYETNSFMSGLTAEPPTDTSNIVFSAINRFSAQGFVCAYVGRGAFNSSRVYDSSKVVELSKRYIVVCFRGSESNVEDWFTNSDADPFGGKDERDEQIQGKVHAGFYKSYRILQPQMIELIENYQTLLGGSDVPVYFTGHSLGGAIATIAAKEYGQGKSVGAVYTFGAPRMGDYRYFLRMKTPVYRIVNSSDLVPRLPTGAYTVLFIKILQGIKYFFDYRKGPENEKHSRRDAIARGFDRLIARLEKISYYRHTGDLRYLTDVPSKDVGKESTSGIENLSNKVEVLPNPSRYDQVAWFFDSVKVAFGSPVASHTMNIYRKKLCAIALRRLDIPQCRHK